MTLNQLLFTIAACICNIDNISGNPVHSSEESEQESSHDVAVSGRVPNHQGIEVSEDEEEDEESARSNSTLGIGVELPISQLGSEQGSVIHPSSEEGVADESVKRTGEGSQNSADGGSVGNVEVTHEHSYGGHNIYMTNDSRTERVGNPIAVQNENRKTETETGKPLPNFFKH